MPTVKRTNDEWRALLADQRASGQSQEDWCAANGVNLFTLRDRASRLKRMDREAEPQPAQSEAVAASWLEIKREGVPALEKAGSIRIERGGFVITVDADFDAELLLAVLHVVNRVCC